jgi:hypothetical protein
MRLSVCVYSFSAVSIQTFSLPAITLRYPAITICKRHNLDVGQYIRAIYNNFESVCSEEDFDGDYNYTCNQTTLLRREFTKFFHFNKVSDKL